MMKVNACLFLAFAATASAFAPAHVSNSALSNVAFTSETALSMASGEKISKRKRVLKTIGKVAGLASTVALATTGAPPAAFAAKKVVEVVETVDNTNKIIGTVGGAIFAGAATMKILGGEKGTVEDFLEAEPYWDQKKLFQ